MSDLAPGARIIPARAGFTRCDGGRERQPADHPRSRGVYSTTGDPARGEPGSSPLARGLPTGPGVEGAAARIIPARAGFTRSCVRRESHGRDHPRSRGVYPTPSPAGAAARGSSPLARGLHEGGDARPVGARIIPARAGFTTTISGTCAPPMDHPRSRGVYRSRRVMVRAASGSSPLARGLPRIPGVQGDANRIIPARAGFTPRPHGDGEGRGDHPRSRGVYQRVCGDPPGIGGSSPLARGLLPAGYHRLTVDRIIPARAGFTRAYEFPCRMDEDHPRSRGVYGWSQDAPAARYGSSPLARGLRGEDRQVCGREGIIPARAGFTGSQTRSGIYGADHPRSRGVYNISDDYPAGEGWIIPARAGFT